ncbi:MAG: cell envelope integrity protein CreD [Betaproteobacteria bacterium]|jgi:inner membrane protein|nr:cell envelope integrity protein CreD [Rubrivivax sp.]
MNRFPLLGKLLTIAALTAVLLVALAAVRGIVNERSSYRQQALAEVAAAHAGPQTVVGPVLWWPYTETLVRTVKDDTEAGPRQRQELVTEEHALLVYPAALKVRSQLVPEQRQRGIFPVTVYVSQHQASGEFVLTEPQPARPGGQVKMGRPLLLMGVSDARGLLGAPRVQIAGQAQALQRAPARAPLPLAAEIDPDLLRPGATLSLELQFELAGTGRIGWVPLADDTTVTLTSAWPHPSFGGSFLPRSRSVSAQGFEATWRVPALSTQAQAMFTARGDKRPPPEQFHVTLADPIDPYRLAERAAKYGLLFIGLTFAAFFVLETVRRWRIHPVQYLMIGAALVLFFLMLLSIAEHLPFAVAYALATTACIGLLAHYLRHVLGGWGPGLGMTGLLAALYGVLYGILMSEDNALLMGSLLLFGVLAGVMTVTRKLDWYGVGKPAAPLQSPRA